MKLSFRIAAACAALMLAATGAQAAAQGTQTITEHDQCHTCDMWITKWPGPKAEIVMKSGNVYKFCSVKCMTCTLLRGGQNAKMAGIWVNDAGATDWEHPEPKFIEAKKAWFVQGSSRKATMGKSVAPFATKQAALEFQKKYGGKIYRFNELTKEILGCGTPKKKPIPME